MTNYTLPRYLKHFEKRSCTWRTRHYSVLSPRSVKFTCPVVPLNASCSTCSCIKQENTKVSMINHVWEILDKLDVFANGSVEKVMCYYVWPIMLHNSCNHFRPTLFTNSMKAWWKVIKMYCIAGNFRGWKTFVNFEVLWLFAKVFSTKIVFLINLRKFSPSKVSCYMVPQSNAPLNQHLIRIAVGCYNNC